MVKARKDGEKGGMKIEKGIPVPALRKKYSWPDMEVGDSMLFPITDWNTVRSSAYAWAARHGVKFVTRVTDDGIRVWRVA